MDQACVQIAQYIAGNQAEGAETLLSAQTISRRVALWPVAAIMRLPVDFDRQARRQASKIKRVGVQRELLAEFVAAGTLLQLFPEQDLGQAHFLSQPAGAFYLFDRLLENAGDPSTTGLRPAVPLPVPGRI